MKQIVPSNQNSSVYPCPFPCCIWKNICGMYKKLKKCARKYKVYDKKHKRITELAIPVRRYEKYQPKLVKKFEKSIEIVKEHKISTRLEQLAFAQSRRLLSTKYGYSHVLDDIHLQSLNRQIRNTILSLYFRLANSVPPKREKAGPKWSPKDWQRFKRRLKKLAAPKKQKKPAQIPRKSKPLEELKRINKLAKPRLRPEVESTGWVYKASMGTQIPSKRIKELAMPYFRENIHYKNPEHISRSALTYQATSRINQIAEPQSRRAKDSDIKVNPFEISENALKYKATERILELAEPKDYPAQPIMDGKVSPTALTYRATPRIIKLAQPKERYG